MNRRVVVFAKRPALGYVKTRLSVAIGPERALKVYQNVLDYTLGIAEKYSPMVYWTGPGEAKVVEFMKEQCEGDLGQRMREAFETELHEADKVVLIGSDCPELSHAIVDQALDLLDKNDVVLGPATDGGYYLIGMNAPFDALFEGVPWSTSTVFQTSLNTCRKWGKSVATLPMLSDLDELADIEYKPDRAWLLE